MLLDGSDLSDPDTQNEAVGILSSITAPEDGGQTSTSTEDNQDVSSTTAGENYFYKIFNRPMKRKKIHCRVKALYILVDTLFKE